MIKYKIVPQVIHANNHYCGVYILISSIFNMLIQLSFLFFLRRTMKKFGGRVGSWMINQYIIYIVYINNAYCYGLYVKYADLIQFNQSK